mgnify:CR=1 FL=1
MRRIRMMIGALLAAACLVPATAFALGASGLTLASPEVREGTSDIALALRAEGDAAQDVSSVRVTLSVATAVPEDMSLITGAEVVDAPSAASVARAVFNPAAQTVDVIVSAGRSALSVENGEVALGALRLACSGEDVAVRVSVLGVEALGTSYSDLSADAPEDPIDLVLNSSKDDGDADGDGGSGSGSGSEGGSTGQSGDGGSGSGSGDAGSAGGSAGSNPDGGSSSDQGGSAGPLATTGDPLNSIALVIGVIAAASCAAVALAAVSLRRSAREDN